MNNYFRMLNEAFIERDDMATLNESRMEDNFISAFDADLLARFKALKNRMRAPENDLGYWIGRKNRIGEEAVDELDNFLTNLENTKTRREKREIAEEGAELIYEDDDWKVYHITTYEAAAKYGAHTRWCITGRYEGHESRGQMFFDTYLPGGDDERYTGYYFFIKKGNDAEKYAVCPRINGGYDVWDPKDGRPGYVPNGPTNVPGLEDVPVRADDDYDYDLESEQDDDLDDEDWVDEPEDEDEVEETTPRERPFDLVNVQPEQIVAGSLEEALAHFDMSDVETLSNGMHIVSYKVSEPVMDETTGEILDTGERFTLFIFQNGEASPLYTQTEAGQFARVDFKTLEFVRDWARNNLGSIRVQDSNHPENNDEQPDEQPEPTTEEDDLEEVEEALTENPGCRVVDTKEKAQKETEGTKWALDRYYQTYRDAGCTLEVCGEGEDRILTVTRENGTTIKFDINDNIVGEDLVVESLMLLVDSSLLENCKGKKCVKESVEEDSLDGIEMFF